MAEGRRPRPPTDEESAPLLRGQGPSNANGDNHNRSLGERISHVTQEPLTALSKVLLILTLVFLLVASIFIGLFAGATYKLRHHDEDRPSEPPITATVTRTATATSTATATFITTRTKGSTAIATATATATKISITTATATTTQVSTKTTTETSVATSVRTKTVGVPLPGPTREPHDGKTCFSPECIQLSASILSSLDTSVDPCENFYEFANNGWLRQNPLPADKGSYGNFNSLANQNKRIIREILESTSTPENLYDERILQKLRGMYGSCMDENHLNEIGQRPLQNIVAQVSDLFDGKSSHGEESSLDEKTRRKGLTSALGYLHSRGVPALFNFEIEGDAGVDPNDMTLWFSQPELGLPSKEYYEEDDIVKLYTNVIERLLLALSDDVEKVARIQVPASNQAVFESTGDPDDPDGGPWWPPNPWPYPEDPEPGDPDDPDDDDKGPISAKKLARDVVEFEKRIAKASLDLDILYQDPLFTYNPMPLKKLTDRLPQVNFDNYFAAFTPRNYPKRVIVTYPDFVDSLSLILDETKPRTIKGYLISRAALYLSSYLGLETDAWKAQRTLVETLQGIKKGAVGDRGEYCLGVVESTLGFAAGRYFTNVTFGGDSRKKGVKVIKDIVGAFKHSLDNLEWMDGKSAKAAAEKADALAVKVGYPLSPDTLSPRSIYYYYNLVKGKPDDFFGNVLSAQESDVYKMWQKLGKQRDREEWLMWPSMVNAYYNPPGNEIVFPAGILQPPFFSKNWPGYLSYGAFGMVAAHELTHAFDSAGRLYNQHGKLEEWWTEKTSKGFRERQDCIAKQYSKYYVLDPDGNKVYVNANLTSGENIGDSGIIQAYRAWKAQYDESLEDGNEYILPGLGYTREQMFFISFARAWAQNIKPAAAVQRVRTDPHSPNKFRVDGTLFNVPEFAEAFKCSKKSKLNPPMEKRCMLW